MSKCSFPSPSFVQTFRVTTKKEENHISTEFLLRMMEIVKFNIPPSLTSVSTTSLNAKAFKSKLFRRLHLIRDHTSYLHSVWSQHFTFEFSDMWASKFPTHLQAPGFQDMSSCSKLEPVGCRIHDEGRVAFGPVGIPYFETPEHSGHRAQLIIFVLSSMSTIKGFLWHTSLMHS